MNDSMRRLLDATVAGDEAQARNELGCLMLFRRMALS